MESIPLEKRKKRESIFAIDVEMLNISAEVGDGVEMTVQVQSIFSENARIGVLLEGLELRAIDDSVEEMLRALNLVTAAKTKLLFPNKEEKSKPKETSSSKIGRVRFCIKKLTADIEEQPIQGWLDKHYQLLKKEACELAVRLNFLDEFISKGAKSRGVAEKKDFLEGGKIHFNGEEIDVEDTSTIQKLQEEIYKKSFRSYYQACQNLVQSQGSGACSEGFQGGFEPSTARSPLFSVSATKLDVSLTRIEGGDSGMIEILQKLDPVCRAQNIPFSRLYGSNINLHTVANLSIRNPSPDPPPLKKEKSLPWWDEMRNYIHGNTSLYFSVSQWHILASTDPYEKSDKLQIRSAYVELQQADGRVYCFTKDFKILLSSLESLLKNSNLKCPSGFSSTFIEAPAFSLEVIMEPSLPIHDNQSSLCSVGDHGVFDAAGCGPMEPDSLSVFPTPACIKHMPLDDDDPAKGLTFSMNKIKYELYYGRGK
ncbi:hypothetical protein FXO38_25100 [Capsicum annuum]|uniref:FMP27/BLTP2/Hobbit GFWDK motif-containing RBG unit domain-containing protein n=1 Tax=Capsicum annuum TaxID=4072 RepID=A0A2G2Z4S2_CAPAN|nr:hypothetical protein FXO38_25100 [Capsicum annuum]KAF3662272.1 hypothetical protein FXO37_12544 [Capsicum annuum]PHT77017.1 hypothetical protein T459_20539 [Capsicum annuum]